MQSRWMGEEQSVWHCSAGFRVRYRQSSRRIAVCLRVGQSWLVERRGWSAEEILARTMCRQAQQSPRRVEQRWSGAVGVGAVGSALTLTRRVSFSVTCWRGGALMTEAEARSVSDRLKTECGWECSSQAGLVHTDSLVPKIRLQRRASHASNVLASQDLPGVQEVSTVGRTGAAQGTRTRQRRRGEAKRKGLRCRVWGQRRRGGYLPGQWLTWTARRRAGKNENQVKEKMLGKAPAEGTIGSAAGCGGRASGTLLGLRKGRGGKGTGGEGGQEDARQGRRGRCRVAAVPEGVVLTRQVFSIFSPYFSAPGPYGARGQVPGWQGRPAGVGTACAPVQPSQHGLGLGPWAWPPGSG